MQVKHGLSVKHLQNDTKHDPNMTPKWNQQLSENGPWSDPGNPPDKYHLSVPFLQQKGPRHDAKNILKSDNNVLVVLFTSEH